MSFRRTYDEIRELIRKKLLDQRIARAIVRKSGVRAGAGGGGDGDPGNLFESGKPWDVITKLSDTDYDVGWRQLGIGNDNQAGYGPGPPCNIRVLHWGRLRDSLLRSGTSNSGRFGYAIDKHVQRNESIGLSSFGAYYERFGLNIEEVRLWESGSLIAGSPNTLRFLDFIFNHTKDQARFIAYVTKADYPYTITLYLNRTPSTESSPYSTFGQRKYQTALSTTGRYVSDWFDFAPAPAPPAGWPNPYYHGLGVVYAMLGSTVSIPTTSNPPVSIPNTFAELREGVGPICMPFFEVEVRTVYNPEFSYWIQDDYTPDEYRVAQWEVE